MLSLILRMVYFGWTAWTVNKSNEGIHCFITGPIVLSHFEDAAPAAKRLSRGFSPPSCTATATFCHGLNRCPSTVYRFNCNYNWLINVFVWNACFVVPTNSAQVAKPLLQQRTLIWLQMALMTNDTVYCAVIYFTTTTRTSCWFLDWLLFADAANDRGLLPNQNSQINISSSNH